MPLLIECDRKWAGIGIDNGWPNFYGFRLGWVAIHWVNQAALYLMGKIARARASGVRDDG